MNLALNKKVFLVTGASRGIGKSIATRFLEEGATVVLLARGTECLETAINELKGLFPASTVLGFAVDCCDEQALERVKPLLIESVDHLDGIVLNVGSGISVNDAIPSASQWDLVWQCNFESAIKTLRVFLPHLNEGDNRSITFISSICGLEITGAPIDYSTAKSALIAFSQNLAHKLAPNIRVNSIAPGNILFEGGRWDNKIKENPTLEKAILERVPLGRFGSPKEVADAVLFLSSDLATFITGQVIRVDGGQVARVL